jgi:hypothetical protein
MRSWGLRPRLYAVARFAGLIPLFNAVLELAPQAYAVARFAGLMPLFDAILSSRPRLYAFARFRGVSEVARVSVVFLVLSLHLFKGFSTNLTLYTLSVSQTRFRRKSLKFAKQFRDLWAF